MNSDLSSITSNDLSNSNEQSNIINKKVLFDLEEGTKPKPRRIQLPKKSILKKKKSRSITQIKDLNKILEKVKISPKKSKKKKKIETARKKNVIFSLIPQIKKLKDIQIQYMELLNQSKRPNKSKSTKNINFKKKNIELKSEENTLSFKRRIRHAKTLKISNNTKKSKSNNFELNSSTETINRSFNEGVSRLNLGKQITLKKNTSFTDLFKPLPEMKIVDKVHAEKLKRFSIMIRRQEYNINLKKKNIAFLYGKKVILIQKTWRRFFKNVYVRNVIKIQKYIRGFLIRKKIINDRLIIIRFVIKLCYFGRVSHFHFFICQLKKLIRAIFFKKEILTKDISIQADISLEKKNTENINITLSELFNSEKASEISEKKEEEINKENKYEFMLNKMSKLLFNGNVTGIKNFPRPYLEVGNNLKILQKRFLKENLENENLIVNNIDMKYSGKTNQLIIDFSNKENLIKKMNNEDLSFSKFNLDFINENNNKQINKNELEDEIEEKKIFLKSKNIKAEEFNILKSDKYINLIRKKITFDNKWSKYSKNYYITIAYRKINLLQRNIKIFLKKINEEKEEIKVKKETKKKLFKFLFKESILNHIRKYVFKKLFPEKNKKERNSLCIIRTQESENNVSHRKNQRNKNINLNLNNFVDTDSVIFNDNDIYIFVTKDNQDSYALKKYNIDKKDINSYFYS